MGHDSFVVSCVLSDIFSGHGALTSVQTTHARTHAHARAHTHTHTHTHIHTQDNTKDTTNVGFREHSG